MGSRPQSLFRWVSNPLLQNGFVHEAMELFNSMIQRTVVSWNAIISGFTQNGHCKEVLKIFQEMQLAGAIPDSKAFASVLSTSMNLADLEVGMGILMGRKVGKALMFSPSLPFPRSGLKAPLFF